MKKLNIRFMTEEEVMEYLIKISNEKDRHYATEPRIAGDLV